MGSAWSQKDCQTALSCWPGRSCSRQCSPPVSCCWFWLWHWRRPWET